LLVKNPLNAIEESIDSLLLDRETILKLPFIERSPYRGLKRFNAKDKDLFFGRALLIAKIIETNELQQAIELPAAKHGVIFESDLVEEIVRDVRGQAGSLPLLQYTLDLLWKDENLSDRTLNIETARRLKC
jgi:hypothetical protein